VPRAGDSIQGAWAKLVPLHLSVGRGNRRAILEGPWKFGSDLLVVADFDSNKRLKDLEFTHIPVWV
jgi:hypothetical protein